MRMSVLLEQLEQFDLEERADASKDPVTRAMQRIADAYNGKSIKSKSGPQAALDAIAQRIDKTSDSGKLEGLASVLQEILSKGGTKGMTTKDGEKMPDWTLNSTQKKFLEMLLTRIS